MCGYGSRDIDQGYNIGMFVPPPSPFYCSGTRYGALSRAGYGRHGSSRSAPFQYADFGERPRRGQNAADFLKTETCVEKPKNRLQEFVEKAVKDATHILAKPEDVTIINAYINEYGNGEAWFFFVQSGQIWHYRYHIANNDLSTVKKQHINMFSSDVLALMQSALADDRAAKAKT